MSADSWSRVIGPKIQGTRNLDACFRNGVDFFVVLSSICAVTGNDGQTNYTAACGFQDELVRQRTAAGLHAFSMNVGPVSDVGLLSELPAKAKEIQRRGLGFITIAQLLSMLNYAITHQAPSGDADTSVCAISPRPYSENKDDRDKDRGRRFAHLVKQGASSGGGGKAGSDDALKQLERASSFEEAVGITCAVLLRQLGKLIATPENALSAKNSLDHYGVDSLTAVEMRNWIVAYLQVDLPLMSIRGTGSIWELAELSAKESPLVGAF